MKAREVLLRLDFACEHDMRKVLNKIQSKEFTDIESKEFNKKYKKELADLKSRGVKTLTILDEDYPDAFKNVILPPLVIYYTGDLKVLKDAIANKTYSYLEGPNKFNFDTDKLISFMFGIITFGTNELNLWTDMSIEIGKLIPACAKNIICTKKLKANNVFNYVVECSLAFNLLDDVYVVPTLEPSINNDLINEGAILLDRKELISKC